MLSVYVLVVMLLAVCLRAGKVEARSNISPPSFHCRAKMRTLCRTPMASSTGSFLDGVAAVSANDVWAVGFTGFDCCDELTVIEHWDGASWHIIPSPSPAGPGQENSLSDVVALSANNIWAVGNYYNGNPIQGLIIHWDGTSWQVVPSPSLGSQVSNYLYGIAAVSANDIWAAGQYASTGSTWLSLVEHWDGSSWKVVPSPNVAGATSNSLGGMKVIAANDIWATGLSITPSSQGNNTNWAGFIAHWDGSSWSIVPSPVPPNQTGFYTLGNVVADSPTDAWTTGMYYGPSGGQTLTEHWNGSSWRIVPSPDVSGSTDSEIGSTVMVTATDIWTTGFFSDSSNVWQTLIEHWNGTQWSIVPSPNFGGPDTNNALFALAALSASDIWAVGANQHIGGQNQALIEQWNGTQWKIVPPGT